MSTAIFPLAVWQSGTNENSIPANDNALRMEVVEKSALTIANSAPGSPSDGDVHIVGTAWGSFATNDVVIYQGGTWLGFLPFSGWTKTVGTDLYMYNGSGWVQVIDGGSASRNSVTALSIASGVVNIDCSLGDYFTLALTANVTSITFSNLPGSGKGASLAIRLQQDATGSRTVAFPASFKAITGSDTSVQSAANARTILMISTFDNGTRWEYSMKAGAA